MNICFDIGIRNLAWCSYNSDNKKILGWQNYDLMNDSDVADTKKVCSVCSKNALYEHKDILFCTRHCVKPIFKDLSGNVYKKFPTISVLKEILKCTGKKEELVQKIKEQYCLPIQKKSAVKKGYDMESLHDSIRTFVLQNKELFSKAKHIGLENQPVLKNPTMKTVQVMLYATLRDMLEPIPKMHLIHALKKVQDKEAGSAGYSDRKKASVEKANLFLKENAQDSTFVEMFRTSKKQNDLSDALLMCLDFSVKI